MIFRPVPRRRRARHHANGLCAGAARSL